MEENNITAFWSLYDQYILDGDISLRPKLSTLLAEIEQKDRRTQLLRPEKKGWNTILAWQVLRTQEFIFSDTSVFHLHAGEILAWTPHWDRDVFLTRLPALELVSGRILKPGFQLTNDDQGTASDYEWDQTVRALGITNEKGLYLPIYDAVTLMKLCDQQIATMRPRILQYLKGEKGFSQEVLEKL